VGWREVQLGLGLLLGIPWERLLLREVMAVTMVKTVNVPVTIAFTMITAAIMDVLACTPPTLRGLRIQSTEALRDH